MNEQANKWANPDEPDLGMAEAFGRDPILEKSVRDLVKKYQIQTVVESGTWRGYTAKRFSEFTPLVYTIENNRNIWRYAIDRTLHMRASNVVPCVGSSEYWLPLIIPGLSYPALFYLDAHWDDYWPILDEIAAIVSRPDPCVIVIHDVLVPGTDFGFDSYKGQDLTFEYLKPALDKLKFDWAYRYNTEASGHRRGVLFVEPKI